MASKLFALALKVQAMRKAQIKADQDTLLDEQDAWSLHRSISKLEGEVDKSISDILLADPNEKNQLELTALQIAEAMAILGRALEDDATWSTGIGTITKARKVLQSAYLTATGKGAVKV